MLMDAAAYLCIALMIGVLVAMCLIVNRPDKEKQTDEPKVKKHR